MTKHDHKFQANVTDTTEGPVKQPSHTFEAIECESTRQANASLDCRYDGTLDEVKDEPWRLLGLDKVQTGHRLNFETHQQALSSLFRWHNETFNAWSHILGAFICIFAITVIIAKRENI